MEVPGSSNLPIRWNLVQFNAALGQYFSGKFHTGYDEQVFQVCTEPCPYQDSLCISSRIQSRRAFTDSPQSLHWGSWPSIWYHWKEEETAFGDGQRRRWDVLKSGNKTSMVEGLSGCWFRAQLPCRKTEADYFRASSVKMVFDQGQGSQNNHNN